MQASEYARYRLESMSRILAPRPVRDAGHLTEMRIRGCCDDVTAITTSTACQEWVPPDNPVRFLPGDCICRTLGPPAQLTTPFPCCGSVGGGTVGGGDGFLYVANYDNSRISRLNLATGVNTNIVTTGGDEIQNPANIVHDIKRNVIYIASGVAKVYLLNLSTNVVSTIFNSIRSNDAIFGIALDSTNDVLYFAINTVSTSSTFMRYDLSSGNSENLTLNGVMLSGVGALALNGITLFASGENLISEIPGLFRINLSNGLVSSLINTDWTSGICFSANNELLYNADFGTGVSQYNFVSNAILFDQPVYSLCVDISRNKIYTGITSDTTGFNTIVEIDIATNLSTTLTTSGDPFDSINPGDPPILLGFCI